MHKGDVIIYMLFSFVVEEFSTSIFIQVSRKKIKTYNDHCTSSVSWNLALGLLGKPCREREFLQCRIGFASHSIGIKGMFPDYTRKIGPALYKKQKAHLENVGKDLRAIVAYKMSLGGNVGSKNPKTNLVGF